MKPKELIDQYLLGKLSAYDQENFAREVSKDKELKVEVIFRKEMIEGLYSIQQDRLKEQFMAFKSGHIPIKDSKKKPASDQKPKWKLYRPFLSVAASIVTIIVVYLLIHIWSTDKRLDRGVLFAQHFEMPAATLIVVDDTSKGNRDSSSQEIKGLSKNELDWRELVQSYERKDYGQALTQLEKLDTTGLTQLTQSNYIFLAGALYLEKGELNKAADFLNHPRASNPQQAVWYRSLLLIKSDAPKEDIIKAFSEIAKVRNPFQQEAKQIVDQLKVAVLD